MVRWDLILVTPSFVYSSNVSLADILRYVIDSISLYMAPCRVSQSHRKDCEIGAVEVGISIKFLIRPVSRGAPVFLAIIGVWDRIGKWSVG